MSNKKDCVYVTPIATEYRYYLDESVSNPQDYHELFELLNIAGENDCVRIIISNFGGSLTTCLAIVNSIRACRAVTIGVLASVAYSAGGVVWLACEGQEVQQHAGFMGHDAQGGSFGSLYQQKQSIEHEMVMLRSLYEDVYEHFLSTQEIEVLLKNGDLWLNEKDIIQRLDKRQELYQAQDLDRKAEQEAAMEEMFNSIENEVPVEVLAKVNKANLIRYINSDIDILVDEEGKPLIVELDINKA